SLRYIAKLTPELLEVKLSIVKKSNKIAQINPCDNIFIIQSDWYQSNPLIIQGPGAGKEVTSAAVLNDLIEVLKS
ncbi:MAG: hypothetical protein JKX98_10955, partial [Alcanivoracaceae bacterium]|nr:hypothetical protein [Alcanivoracaceae bacterium]